MEVRKWKGLYTPGRHWLARISRKEMPPDPKIKSLHNPNSGYTTIRKQNSENTAPGSVIWNLPPKFCTHVIGWQEMGANVGVTANAARDKKVKSV